ncbi:MAG: UDP-N-acetylmuramate dehydrogenase, partial [Halomonas sp.]|nr:UDP-N-acetylmuramate dehydrogenase [Halomonas sp.]
PPSPAGGGVTRPAGGLSQRGGLRGYRLGILGGPERPALVLVHFGGGNAAELLAFADRVAERVRERFGVILEREPRLA